MTVRTFVRLRKGRWTSYGTVGFHKQDQRRVLRNHVSRLLAQGYLQQSKGQAKKVQGMTEHLIRLAIKDNNEAHRAIVQFIRIKHPDVLPNLYRAASLLKDVPERVISLKAVTSIFDRGEQRLLVIPGRERCVAWELLVREEARRQLEKEGAVRTVDDLWIAEPTRAEHEVWTAAPATRLDRGREKKFEALLGEKERRASFAERVRVACAQRGVTAADFRAAVERTSRSGPFRAYIEATQLEALDPEPLVGDSPLKAVENRNPRSRWRFAEGIHRWKFEKEGLAHHEVLPRAVLEDFDDRCDQVVAGWHRWDRGKFIELVKEKGGGWGRRDVEKAEYYRRKTADGTLSDADLFDLRREKLTPASARDPPRKYRRYRQFWRREGLYF